MIWLTWLTKKTKGKNKMDQINKYRLEMTKKHYPIYWKIKNNEIERIISFFVLESVFG